MGLLSALLGHATEADVDDVEQTLQQILAEDENVERAFRLVRDLLIFTNRRFILVDRQGMTGRKTKSSSRITVFSGVLDRFSSTPGRSYQCW